MPGPKFPQAYPQYFHTIAAKLISERPERLEVDVPIQAGYARSHFNYFRQSWMRYYEFMTKAKDFDAARVALDTYNKLVSYEVKIAPPRTLIFTSKDVQVDLVMRESGRVETELREWLPRMEDKKVATRGSRKTGRIHLSDTSNLPVFDAKEMDEAAARVFGLKPKEKKEQVMPDNPPLDPPSPPLPTENKYGLPIGPPPGFADKK